MLDTLRWTLTTSAQARIAEEAGVRLLPPNVPFVSNVALRRALLWR